MSLQSQIAAKAALAAQRQGKYLEFHNTLLESDSSSDETIKSISDKLGLNYAALQKDMDDPKINQALERNHRLATALGVNGTPSYLIGEQFIPGAIDSASLAKVMSDERAKLINVTLTKKTAERGDGQRR
jgi:protein-disulfide isomerase